MVATSNADKTTSGKKLFQTLGCTECHTVSGVASNKLGPDLMMAAKNNNRSRDWLYTQIISPQTHNQKSIMPPFAQLSQKNINLLIAYLQGLATLPGPAAPPPPPPAAAGAATDTAAQIKYGEQLFNSVGCVQCHTITGSSNSVKLGPDLIFAIKRDKPTKDWLKDQLTNPQSHNPTSVMPSFAAKLNDQQMSAMIEFLSSLSTRTVAAGAEESGVSAGAESAAPSTGSGVMAAGVIGDKEHGAILFHQSCIMCHGPHGDNKNAYNGYYVNANMANGDLAPKGVPRLNPIDRAVFSSDPQAFINHIDQFLQHGIPNTEGGPNMPAFGDSHALSQAQIADLEAYVLSLNGVDRTMIMNPGIEPKEFFYMLLWLSMVIVMLAGCYWFVMRLLKT
jgi:mono/diheme cytochrome c family protein